MTEQAKRRWYSFSLRTMFILVTVLCIWLGWQLNLVRERRDVLKEPGVAAKFNTTTADGYVAMYAGTPPDPVARISFVRRMLGDEAIQQVWYQGWGDKPTAEELARMQSLFPEAKMSEYLPEPCHPGCFPRGTLVETPEGRRRIEEIQPGDFVLSLKPDGTSTTVEVKTVFVTDNHLWIVETELGELVTTETQPLCLQDGATCQAGKLKAGDTVLFHYDGAIEPVRVKSVALTERTEPVFNLILGDSEIFVAGGYLARSKPPAASVATDGE